MTFIDVLESGCGLAMRLWARPSLYNSCGSSDSSDGRKSPFLREVEGVSGEK